MQNTIDELIKTARMYKNADSNLERVCGEELDPIACTVFAYRGMHTEILPDEAHDAGFYLDRLTKLHGILVNTYNMDNDEVRKLWFPILNA